MIPERLRSIFWKEFIQMRRDRATFAMMLAVPAFQLLLFGFAVNLDVRNLPATVLDFSRTQQSRDLIQLGAYVAGSDAETDRAILLYPGLQRFLLQDMREAAPMGDSLRGLQTALQEDKPQREAPRAARPHHNPYET